jgi:hypothetical protein
LGFGARAKKTRGKPRVFINADDKKRRKKR